MATEKQIRLGSLHRIMTSTFGSPVGQWAFSFSWAQLELQIADTGRSVPRFPWRCRTTALPAQASLTRLPARNGQQTTSMKPSDCAWTCPLKNAIQHSPNSPRTGQSSRTLGNHFGTARPSPLTTDQPPRRPLPMTLRDMLAVPSPSEDTFGIFSAVGKLRIYLVTRLLDNQPSRALYLCAGNTAVTAHPNHAATTAPHAVCHADSNESRFQLTTTRQRRPLV